MILQNWDQLCITSSFRTLPSVPVWSWTIAAGLALVGIFFGEETWLCKTYLQVDGGCKTDGEIHQCFKLRENHNQEQMPIHKEKTSQWLHPQNKRRSPEKGPFQKERIVFQAPVAGEYLLVKEYGEYGP